MTALNVVVYAVALVLGVAAYLKGGERHILGVTEAIKTLLLVLPTLIMISDMCQDFGPLEAAPTGVARSTIRRKDDHSWATVEITSITCQYIFELVRRLTL
jgi:hypothetical protein